MSGRRQPIWFWQRILSPHMAGLAAALSRQGCEVVYVAEQPMSKDRARQGWTLPDIGNARLELAPSEAAVRTLADAAPVDSAHICQGIRANGRVGRAQRALAARGLRQWVVMESVDDSGLIGFLKRIEYRRLFSRSKGRLEGVLATGHRTANWVVARGMPEEAVFPFAYFLPEREPDSDVSRARGPRFQVVFVGSLIERKRVDLLFGALSALALADIELVVIGSGPLERELRQVAKTALPGRVRWVGTLPIAEVPPALSQADCLVLPSRHDGWGAVVSEALMVGTPAICSDECGSAEVVYASGVGGVFRSGDRRSLVDQLERAVNAGSVSAEQRTALAQWARCLGAEAGARYLRMILEHSISEGAPRPASPWFS